MPSKSLFRASALHLVHGFLEGCVDIDRVAIESDGAHVHLKVAQLPGSALDWVAAPFNERQLRSQGPKAGSS